MIVGFYNDKRVKSSKINDKEYKVLKMEFKPDANIEEITI